MKKIFLLVSLVMALSGKAQLWVCGGLSATLQAPNAGSLTNVTYSLNPGGLTSTTGSFVLTTTVSASYTLYTTGLNQSNSLVTISTQTSVNFMSVPVFTLTSPQNFNVGCSGSTLSVVEIANAQASSTVAGAVSYSILYPGGGVLPSNIPLSSVSAYSFSTPGTYTAVVRNNANGCDTYQPFQVGTNTTALSLSNISIQSNVISCTNPTAYVTATANSNMTFKWYPSGVTSTVVAVGGDFSSPHQSVAATLTLEVSALNTACPATTVVTVLQNIAPPNAVIQSSGLGICGSGTVQLSNFSTSNILPPFNSNGPVNSYLWEGPAPQYTFGPSSTITGSIAGLYTMHVVDTNNGCTAAGTINVSSSGNTAAFTHTVSNGQVAFTDNTPGTNQSTSYLWNFGDGNYSTQQHPTHTYQFGGSHLVTLVATNSAPSACSQSVTQSVNVTGLNCVANSGFSLAPTTTTLVWNAVPSYPWNVSAARWEWGDGSFSNLLFTSHTYAAPGNYNICLSVTVSCVASSSSCSTYSVYRSSGAANVVQINVVNPETVMDINSIEKKEEVSWAVIPNPSDGEFVIDCKALKGIYETVIVTDLTGREIHSTQINSREQEKIHLEGVSSGIYMVTLRSDGVCATKKLIISR